MNELAVVVLAAGLGKRMGQNLPKVLARSRSKALIEYVLHTAAALAPAKIVVVTGHQRELVEETIRHGAGSKTYSCDTIEFACQKEQLGTGHAAQAATAQLQGFTGTVLILYGDVPLAQAQTLSALLKLHVETHAALSLITLTGHADTSYGKIVRDSLGRVQKIVEHKDCTPQEKLIDETNPGIYAVDASFLTPALSALKNDNAQGEYYLTDILEHAVKAGMRVSDLPFADADEVQGVNTPLDLLLVSRTLMQRKIAALIEAGVEIEDPASLYIEDEVEVCKCVRIGPNVILKGKTKLAKGVSIEGSAYLKDTVVGEETLIKFSVRSEGAVIGRRVSFGPFANLRPGTVLEDDVKVGNFVEVKKSLLKEGAKASHLTYLGDATVGAHANIGAGTITCNYDGYAKFETMIGDGAFIGSNSALVAPVEIGRGATVGAGSVITEAVEPDSLALTRAPQTGTPGWSKRKRELCGKKKE